MRSLVLDYVNVSEALDLLSGYESIYVKLINTFLEHQKNLIQEIEEALKQDRKEARRLVHSCKGIAKNLGASMLYEEATEFESCIIDENLSIDCLIKRQLKAFAKVFDATYQDLIRVSEKSRGE